MYRDYRLIVEYRWGGVTWGDRKTRARDSGVLLHAQGRPGNTKKDFNGPWLRSIEFQIIEGGVGDILPVAGFNEQGEQVRPSVTAKVRPVRKAKRSSINTADSVLVDDQLVGGSRWEDRWDFAVQDVRAPAPVDAARSSCRQRQPDYYVNGQLVNAATEKPSFTEGRIMIQSEGAEVYFRRIALQPLR